MIKNLCIMSEGRTECGFIKNVLAEHFLEYDWLIRPITLPTGKNTIGIHKGGWRRHAGYEYAISGICRTILTEKDADIYTTFFDLYGFPTDIPCYEQSLGMSSPYEKAKLFKNQIKQDVNKQLGSNPDYNQTKFIPYVQPYEFEAFLFVDSYCSAFELSDNDQELEALEQKIKEISESFDTPEHINNSPNTAPSKRIQSLVPEFKKNKAGRQAFSWRIAQTVGIPRLRTVCRHFDHWLTYFETH